MGDTAPSASSDWSAYNAAQSRRERVRPLTLAALEALAAGGRDPRGLHALELGSGSGVEARHLLAHGMSVDTVDADPSVAAAMAELARDGRLRHRTARIEEVDPLPTADLVLANASLPFVPRAAFPAVWARIRAALSPGGVVAVDLFGEHDDWASGDGPYLSRAEVDGLLHGLDVVDLAERDEDGPAFSGPKHWHTFTVVARRPRA